MDNLEICYLPLVEMASAIRKKRLSPVEIVEAILTRIERLNPRVNAYCTLLAENARQQAREAETKVMKGEELGALHGVPVSIKDVIFTKGVRTTGGSRIYENFIPEHDAIVVERLKAAGAIILGKTNTPEFGWVAVTDNQLFGATHNPWHPGMTPGGSSGGAACSVALGMGPLGIGTDGGGSIRVPSSFCGVFGFKPSFGRVPQAGGFRGWETLSHTGPIARTVRDAALALEVIAGRDDRDRNALPDTGLHYLPHLGGDLKGMRVAWSENLGYAVLDPKVAKITRAAIKTFIGLGCQVEEASPALKNPEFPFASIVSIRLATVLKNNIEQVSPMLARLIERNKDRPAADYVNACLEQDEYWRGMSSFFAKYDLLLTPTVAVPPFPLGQLGVREIAGSKVSPLSWMAFTFPFNMTGQPAASVPCGWTEDGLPIGLQIVGRRLDDITVLKAAAAFEQASPWASRRPSLD